MFLEVKMEPAPKTNEGPKLQVGYIIGATVAGFVLTILVLGVLYCIKHRNKKFDVSQAQEMRNSWLFNN